VTYSTGWYEVEIDWLTSNQIDVAVYNSSGALFATTTATDSSYSSGGVGFGFWYQHGAWDYYSSRKYISAVPSASYGTEVLNSGASWAATEDTAFDGGESNENVRLRFTIRNSGDPLYSQRYRLLVASLGGAANCESVATANYSDAPTTSEGCGTSPACMTASSNFDDRSSTTRMLSEPSSYIYVEGQILEDPSNETASSSLSTNQYTEVEYNFQMTDEATDDSYCFRSTNEGAAFDNYTSVARMNMSFAPSITNVRLNAGNDIALIEGTTTVIQATGTVTDLNGYGDLSYATSTIYRSGVGEECSTNEKNCYRILSSRCGFSDCSGNSCTVSCDADIQYFTDPTDIDAFSAEDWRAAISVYDSGGDRGYGTSSAVELLTLLAVDVSSPIDYGSLNVGTDTGPANSTTTVENTGNASSSASLKGTDLTAGASSIGVDNQKYATSTFIYSSCTVCSILTDTFTSFALNLPHPTSTSPVTDEIYWGIFVPVGTAGVTHTGANTFIAVTE